MAIVRFRDSKDGNKLKNVFAIVLKGEQGEQGEKGEKGEQGDTGEKGDAGQNGMGITKATITEDGELVIIYTDGHGEPVGNVVGKQGEKGEKGDPGEVPQDYGEDKFANILAGNKEGAVIRLDDVSPFQGTVSVLAQGGTPTTSSVVRYGKNLCPKRKTSRTINDVIFTVNEDGTIIANGTASADTTLDVVNNGAVALALPLGTKMCISGCPEGGGKDKYYLQAPWFGDNVDTGNGYSGILSKNDVAQNWRTHVSIFIKAGQTAENLVFKPQIEIGSHVTTYEPYVEESSFTVAADGTASVKLLRPTTTLIHSERVSLSVKYNRDTDVVVKNMEQTIEKLENMIVSLGGVL